MDSNEKSGNNVVSESLKRTKTLENQTSSTLSQEDDTNTVIKISHYHETVCNAKSFSHLDCKRCCYIMQKKYYSIDEINNKMSFLLDSTIWDIDTKTKNVYPY